MRLERNDTVLVGAVVLCCYVALITARAIQKRVRRPPTHLALHCMNIPVQMRECWFKGIIPPWENLSNMSEYDAKMLRTFYLT